MTILPMFPAGEFPHKIEAVFFAAFDSPIRLRLFFVGFDGVFMGSNYGKSECYGFRLWE